jgi:hypothetical protein
MKLDQKSVGTIRAYVWVGVGIVILIGYFLTR